MACLHTLRQHWLRRWPFRAVQHPGAAHLVGMIVERGQENRYEPRSGLQIRIRSLARRAVVFNQVLIVLVVRRCEFGEWTQVIRRGGVWLQRSRLRAGREDSCHRARASWSEPTLRTPVAAQQQQNESHGSHSDYSFGFLPEHCDRFDFNQQIGTAQLCLDAGGSRHGIKSLLLVERRALLVEGL